MTTHKGTRQRPVSSFAEKKWNRYYWYFSHKTGQCPATVSSFYSLTLYKSPSSQIPKSSYIEKEDKSIHLIQFLKSTMAVVSPIKDKIDQFGTLAQQNQLQSLSPASSDRSSKKYEIEPAASDDASSAYSGETSDRRDTDISVTESCFFTGCGVLLFLFIFLFLRCVFSILID